MANPFEKRATEYLADTEAFLAIVTPEPLTSFFGRPAREGTLYDRLVVVTGTPGSGKTTLARLFEYATLRSLLQNKNLRTYRPVADALSECHALKDLAPAVVGARVPLESEYRDFWEFPYPEEVRLSLTMALIQSRAMIRWLRQLSDSGIDLSLVEIVPRAGIEAALEQIGGTRGDAVLQRAREVELGIYRVVRALVAPPLSAIDENINAAYHPFDVVEALRFPFGETSIQAIPLVMFDDAHSLHPAQYDRLQALLAQREIKIARWILTRLDALNAAHVLASDDAPGLQRTRVITEVRMQSADRGARRTAFRRMAREMSGRYLRQMDSFNRRRLTDLADLMLTDRPALSPGKLAKLSQKVTAVQRRVGASDTQRAELEALVDNYLQASSSNDWSRELALACTAIALERLGKRVPQLTFDVFRDGEIEPSKPISITSSVVEGARVHLMHEWDVPLYVGFDALCDASAENAEQFLQLASRLVAQAETQLIRGKPPGISASDQHKLLRRRATELVESWDFPLHRRVRQLSDVIARQCVERSLEGNAPLGGGANAWGIPQDQFSELPEKDPDLARVLQFGVAYNAIVLVPSHTTKGRRWCLLELGGPLLVHHGLTLRRGGFIERDVRDLREATGGGDRSE